MRVVISCEQRFERLPDGSLWTPGAFAHTYWTAYQAVFDDVRVVARVRDTTAVPPTMRRVDGPHVSVHALPYYVGPWQFVRTLAASKLAMRMAVRRDDAIVLRGAPAGTLLRKSLRDGHPYGCEVVGDPYDVFAPGVVRHPLRAIFRHWLSAELRRQCHSATAALYVTRAYLQQRYPCPAHTFAASDVQLPPEAFAASPRRSFAAPRRRLVTVGSLDQLYKGQHVLIRSISALIHEGADLVLTFVGDGRYRSELAQLAADRGVAGRVHFVGALPAGAAVREILDSADLFVLPSLTEGLPRALVEAMARALPCIASAVGGIPELLSPDDLTSPADEAQLRTKIADVLGNESRLVAMSERNLMKSHDFEEQRLMKIRIAFMSDLRDATVQWAKGRG